VHYFVFFAASYVYVRKDSSGLITNNILRATNIDVYFLSEENATVFVTLKTECADYFSGTIKVFHMLYENIFEWNMSEQFK